MTGPDIKSELARFSLEAPIEQAWMPPSSWYTEPAFDELEAEAVFQATWQPVARLSDLKGTGAFASGRLSGQPWLLVRGEDGSLRGFHNTCRHKGREVVRGCGVADELVCGYHSWTYDGTGRLKRAPQIRGIEDFDRDAMSLPEISTAEWGLWAFINLASEHTCIEDSMGSLNKELGDPDWGRLRFHAEKTWKIQCNWKVVCDNYLDGGYHIPHMHPTLDAQLDMRSYNTRLFPSFSIQTAPPNPRGDERIEYEATDRIGEAARYAWVYPNLMINRYGPCLDTNLVTPCGPGACEVKYEFFFASDEGESAQRFIEESVAQSDVTQREDIEICESVQLGLSSKSYDTGRYAPRVELGEHHFHKLLAEALQRGLS